jgi:hypothetical protein
MKTIRSGGALVLAGLVGTGGTAFADVKKQEKSHFKFEGVLGGVIGLFGGKAAKEGIVNTVAVRGDRKLVANDQTGEIVDLAEEKVYRLDMKKKTYEVVTFAQLRKEMEEARRKAEEQAREAHEDAREEQGSGGSSTPSEASAPPAQQKQVEVDFDVKETGQRRTINGFDTRQAIMTIAVREKGKTLEQGGGLVLTSDLWLAPKATSENDVAQFDLRYARKLEGPATVAAAQAQMAAALAAYPQMGEALSRMQSEGAKLDGTPILMTTTFEAVKSAEMMAAQQEQAPQREQEQPKGIGGLLGRKIGKKIGASDGPAKPRATILTITNEVLALSKDVAAADVALPAGFRQK